MSVDLFGPKPKRKSPRVMMHVRDAGCGVIQFECSKCGENTGWIDWEKTDSDAKRGIPCKNCNGDQS